MSRLVKIYAVTFMEYTNCMKNTVYNEENDCYIQVGKEQFLVTEDDLDKLKAYGGGYRTVNFVGNIFKEDK